MRSLYGDEGQTLGSREGQAVALNSHEIVSCFRHCASLLSRQVGFRAVFQRHTKHEICDEKIRTNRNVDVCLRCDFEDGRVRRKPPGGGGGLAACDYHAECAFAVACPPCRRGWLGADGPARARWGYGRVAETDDSVTASTRDPGGLKGSGGVKYGDGCCHLRR